MTRIVAGTVGGRRIADAPGPRHPADLRPGPRGALLDAGVDDRAAGCRFADLYAGSGAVGLEAASRGAARVLLVESDPRAARIVRANIAALGLGRVCRLAAAGSATVLARRAGRAVRCGVRRSARTRWTTQEVARNAVAARDVAGSRPTGVVVLERSTRSPEPAWPDGVATRAWSSLRGNDALVRSPLVTYLPASGGY